MFMTKHSKIKVIFKVKNKILQIIFQTKATSLCADKSDTSVQRKTCDSTDSSNLDDKSSITGTKYYQLQ